MNTEIYEVNLGIQSEYRKIRTKKAPYFDTFHEVGQSQIMIVITEIVYKTRCNKILNLSIKFAVYIKIYHFQHMEHQVSPVFISLLMRNISNTANSSNVNFTVFNEIH